MSRPSEPIGARRWPLLGLAGLLSLVGGGLIALVMRGGSAGADRPAVGEGASRRATVSPADPRIAAAFDTLRHHGALAAALDMLERAAADDSVVLRDGHQLAHALGRLAVAANYGDASVLSQCRPDFASGCYHGVVEAFVQVRGRVDMSELERMCAGAGSDDRPGPVHECVHGLGHGVLGAVGDLRTALQDCDELKPGLDAWCRDGAFMEGMRWVLGATTPGLEHEHPERHPGMEHGHSHGATLASQLPLDPADPYSPCDRFGGAYGSACWAFQGFVILRNSGFDPGEALRICDGAPGERVRDCYESIGLQITGLFQRDDAWIIAQCGRGRPDLSPHCGSGAARALVQMDWSGTRAARLCAASPPAWKDACYRTMGLYVGALTEPDQRNALCAGVEPGYLETCRVEE